MNEESSSLVVAALLGIVEGLTEFLPVSSTGHLILAGKALGFTGPVADSFEIFIQLGAILAVVVLYFDRFRNLLRGLFTDGIQFKSAPEFTGASGLAKIALACAPAFVMGALFHKKIKEFLFTPGSVAAALIVGGAIMLLVDNKRREERTTSLEDISYRQAFLLGIFQCCALWPGVSRSGSMLVGGLLLGLSRSVAAEFSFLVAVPVMFAATALDLVKSRELLSQSDLGLFAVGFVVSFITAVFAIRTFMTLLKRINLHPFAIYRIAFGALVLAMLHGTTLS